MTPIICSVDPIFQNLYDTFIVSTYLKHNLQDTFQLLPNYLSKYDGQPYGFCTVSYAVYRQQHIAHLLSFLEKNPDQQHIISMDVDMIFLRGFGNYVTKLIDGYYSTNTNIFLAKDSDIDHKLPNMGIMILKNCTQTHSFLRWLLYYVGTVDRPCQAFYKNMSEYIETHPDHKILLIDNNKMIHNNSPQQLLKHRLVHQQACTFHATSASNIYEKAFVLSQAMCFLEEQGL